jgi:hypothetical protein
MRDFKDSMGFMSGMEKILKHNITYINNSLTKLVSVILRTWRVAGL